MARTVDTPTLTQNNRIYLYRLLSHELGCGKQVFLPTVEGALAGDRMTAEDLGYESTRALLEALDEFVKLTIFKGGRIYATVIAQPVWDEALAALESGSSAKSDGGSKSGKPWKRKKADKALKPVRPKRVKRPEPACDAAIPEAPESAKGTASAQAVPENTAQISTDQETVAEPERATAAQETSSGAERTPAHQDAPTEPKRIADEQPSSACTGRDKVALGNPAGTGHDKVALGNPAGTEQATGAPGKPVDAGHPAPGQAAQEAVVEQTAADGAAPDRTNDAADDPEQTSPHDAALTSPAPAISLTVTYDPYSGIDREVKLESHPVTVPDAAAADRANGVQAPGAATHTSDAGATSDAHASSSAIAQEVSPKPPVQDEKKAHVSAGHAVAAAPVSNTRKPGAAAASTSLETVHEPTCAHTPADSNQQNAPHSDEAPMSCRVDAPDSSVTHPSLSTNQDIACEATAVASPASRANEPSSQPVPLDPKVLATYPKDFAAEVYPPSDAIADLCELLPYGTEVFTLLAEDYERARKLELVSGTRARATFPLRIQHANSVEPIRITLKKRSGSGLKWELCAIE